VAYVVNKTNHRIIISKRLFALSAALLGRMAFVHDQRGPMTSPHCTTPTCSTPVSALTADGRIMWDDGIWRVVRTLREALSSIVVGASRAGVHVLRELLPERAPTASDCHDCSASDWFNAHGELRDFEADRST
jgi:hypothetical protein